MPRKPAAAQSTAAAAPAKEPDTPRRGARASRAQPRSYKEAEEEEGDSAEPTSAPATPSRSAAAPRGRKRQRTDTAATPAHDAPTPRTTSRKADAATDESAETGKGEAAKRARKNTKGTAKAPPTPAMPLAARTPGALMRIGAHVSAAGGVHHAVSNATHIGANAFALFLKSQRKWANPPLQADVAAAFKDACGAHAYAAAAAVLPHGSYLVNLAGADADKAAQAAASFGDDLARCDALGIGLYNFHPGNTNGAPRADAIARLARRLDDAHAASARVVTLLENMAAAPDANTLGGTFADLRDVIALVRDKGRVGVCLDTCHLFAAGYDLRSPDAYAATLAEFDAVIGLKYLKAWHLNDSKGVLGSHRDLHQRIGLGFLGLRAFHNVVNDSRMQGMPMVLETPIDYIDDKGKSVEDKGVWAREIKLLESLVGMDADGDEFKKLEAELAGQGTAERAKMQAQFDKKQAEAAAKASKGGKKKGSKGKEKAAALDDEDAASSDNSS